MLWTWVTDIKVTGFRAGLLIRSKLVVPASFTSRFGRNVCGEWFVGNKCQYQMKQIIVIVVIIALVLLTVIAVTFHRFWKRGCVLSDNRSEQSPKFFPGRRECCVGMKTWAGFEHDG
ncbi:unnamed protein product [Ixodes pacificus]